MSNSYIVILITHGNLAKEMSQVAEKFLPLSIPLYTFSNQKESIETINAHIDAILEKDNPAKVLIFLDLLGGSCMHAAMRLKKRNDKVAILTGVNIPAMLSFSANYERLSWDELLTKIEEDGKKAIKVMR